MDVGDACPGWYNTGFSMTIQGTVHPILIPILPNPNIICLQLFLHPITFIPIPMLLVIYKSKVTHSVKHAVFQSLQNDQPDLHSRSHPTRHCRLDCVLP